MKWTSQMYQCLAFLMLEEVYGRTEWVKGESKKISSLLEMAKEPIGHDDFLIVKNRSPVEFSKVLESILPYFEEAQEKAFAGGNKHIVANLEKPTLE